MASSDTWELDSGRWNESNVADLVFLARLSEQAERYEEMKNFMKKVAQIKKTLNVDERNLMSVAYKNVVGARRASWRVLEQRRRPQGGQGAESRDCVDSYLATVEGELTDICKDILELLGTVLLKNVGAGAETSVQEVFYYKMEGDYHRYMAEYARGALQQSTQESARQAYEKAIEAARPLQATDPIRLGLALNFSVFYYEILQKPQEACKLAKKAFDQAVGELEELDEEKYKDATLIMQLLRDNLTLWQAEDDDDDMMGNVEKDGTLLVDDF